jgi:hypothetical protein
MTDDVVEPVEEQPSLPTNLVKRLRDAIVAETLARRVQK